ncbi:hypothetical protein Ddc_24221 [Ditylenchus destructor]|nr:hypothetical protein Ddc_24221 [Ditylenchus destructor]
MNNVILIFAIFYALLANRFGVLAQYQCLGVPDIQRASLASQLSGQKLKGNSDYYTLGEPIGDDSDGLVLSCKYGWWFYKHQCTVKISPKNDNDHGNMQERMTLMKIKDRSRNCLCTEVLDFGEITFEGKRLSWFAMRKETGTVLDVLTRCDGKQKMPFRCSPAAAAVLLHSYMQIFESVHRARCLHRNINLRNIYITSNGDFIAGNFSRAELVDDWYDLINGMADELIQAVEFLLEEKEDGAGFLDTLNGIDWDYYKSKSQDFAVKAKEYINSLKSAASADYTSFQSFFGDMLVLEQRNGEIPWLTQKEKDLLSARAEQMIEQANRERAAREAGKR